MCLQDSKKLNGIDYVSYYESPLGTITMASDGEALTGLWFQGQKYYANGLSEDYVEKMIPIFEEVSNWLDVYFSGKEPEFMPCVKLKGSEFRKEVWEILFTIPYGKTMTYGEIADQMAKKRGIEKMSAQAVGGAVGHNPISLIVPCHRVVGSNGEMTGYAGGVERKIKLLKMEGAC